MSLNHYKVLLALSKVNVESWDPNYLHLCRLPAEAPAAGRSLHLQRAASESETANTDNPDNRAEYLLPTTRSNWDFEGQKDDFGKTWRLA